MLVFSGWVDRLSDLLGRGVAWLSLLMVLLGAFNAIARYLGRFIGVNLSSNAMLEAQWYMFSLIFLLGAAWTLRQDAHVRVDVFYGRLTPRVKAIVDLIGGVVFLLPFCAFGIWASWEYVLHSWQDLEVSADPGGLPRYPIKLMILVSFGMLILQGLSELIKRIAILRGQP